MRRFSSYGPLDPEDHYYAPRQQLIQKACQQLIGPNPKKNGNYITVWAPRQSGKTWLLREVLYNLKDLHKDTFHVLKINLEDQRDKTGVVPILRSIAGKIAEELDTTFPPINDQQGFQDIFKKESMEKPLILVLDEFDALSEPAINAVVSSFRNIYISRLDQKDKLTHQKKYLLHGVALIGVRSVFGIQNTKGSPFNVQRSLHVPNLSHQEVSGLFHWYQKESGRSIKKEVIDRIYYETRGQPGVVCWLGELLSEGFDQYTPDPRSPITMAELDKVYAAAIYALPNNNILNIIHKAKEGHNKELVLEMFKTGSKLEFTFDEPTINSLYMHGVVDREPGEGHMYYLRFSSPFVQKRLFNYFSKTLFRQLGQLVKPFLNLDKVITPTLLNIPQLLSLYQAYLNENRSWLFKDVPRRSDLRIYEAVFQFNLYAYLDRFLQDKGGQVLPEFPTGNGKIVLLIRYAQSNYGLELKSFTDNAAHRKALEQAALYGNRLGLKEIFLVVFVENIDQENRELYEKDYISTATPVTVKPIFIETASQVKQP